jgi:RNA polymerase sigma-70 factor (ECF subfamily)
LSGTIEKNLEENLLERLKNRDACAFQELIDLHDHSLRTMVGRLMAFDLEMEDVIQNTWMQVWKHLPSFRNQCSIKTWITRIAITQSRNQQRSVRRWVRRLQDRWNLDSQAGIDSVRPENQEDPRWDAIHEAMQRLHYRDREILVLVFLQGNTIQELADALDEKKNTLEVRLHRAKKHLKKIIEERKPHA